MLNSASLYSLEYEKGKLVTAIEGSVGVLTFTSRRDARRFANYYQIILRVQPVGKGRTIRNLCGLYEVGEKIEEWYRDGMPPGMAAPDGTMAYPAVEVLE